MGYKVQYELSLKIKAHNISKALEIMNHLHSDEMLLKHANGGVYGPGVNELTVREKKWYRWVPNPKKPYETIEEAFTNWCIVEDDIEMGRFGPEGDFILSGSFHNKIGQQEFLLEQLAPVLENTNIEVVGEDKTNYLWTIEKGIFTSYSDSESDDE